MATKRQCYVKISLTTQLWQSGYYRFRTSYRSMSALKLYQEGQPTYFEWIRSLKEFRQIFSQSIASTKLSKVIAHIVWYVVRCWASICNRYINRVPGRKIRSYSKVNWRQVFHFFLHRLCSFFHSHNPSRGDNSFDFLQSALAYRNRLIIQRSYFAYVPHFDFCPGISRFCPLRYHTVLLHQPRQLSSALQWL